MPRDKAIRYIVAWLALAMLGEAYVVGLAWASYAGLLGGVGISTGPIRVLVLYDTVEQPINSTAVIHYLRTHCIKDGNTAEFRQWNTEVNAANESDEFVRLLASAHGKLPWAFIQSKSGHVSGSPLPAAPDDQLALFKKWGGP